MEGDAPLGCIVISEYHGLMTTLTARRDALSIGDALLPMVTRMQASLAIYFTDSLKCSTTVMAALLNPHFRLGFFEWAFGKTSPHTIRASELMTSKFNQRQTELAALQDPTQDQTSNSQPNGSQPSQTNVSGNGSFSLYKKQASAVEENGLESYYKGSDPVDSDASAKDTKTVLAWWKVSINIISYIFRIISLAKHVSFPVGLIRNMQENTRFWLPWLGTFSPPPLQPLLPRGPFQPLRMYAARTARDFTRGPSSAV